MPEYRTQGITNVDLSRNIDASQFPDATWSELTDYVPFLQGVVGTNGPVDLLVIGLLYTSSDKISGSTVHVGDIREWYRVRNPTESELSTLDTLSMVERYFSLDSTPSKVIGFVIKT